MRIFTTLEKAKEEAESLNKYIFLVDNYEIHNVTQWIIKNYALTNSIAGVIKNSLRDNTLETYNTLITREMVLQILKEKPMDELHKVVKKGYLQKIRKKHFS